MTTNQQIVYKGACITVLIILVYVAYQKCSERQNLEKNVIEVLEKYHNRLVPQHINRVDNKNVSGQKDLNYLRANSHAYSLAGVNVKNMTRLQLTLTLHSYLDNIDAVCRRKIRMGNINDGGWEVCDDPEVRPVPPCNIYSMGISSDWTFDEDTSRLYGCHVYSIDPSLNLKRFDKTPFIHFYPYGIGGKTEKRMDGWQMYTFADLRKQLGHSNKQIDMVKMDVEQSEWATLAELTKSRALDAAGVKQLILEFHTVGNQQELDGVKSLQALELAGWRRFYVSKNTHCKRKQRGFPVERTSCYEVAYLKKSYYL